MDVILGIAYDEGVLIATSKAFVRGISVLKASDDKTMDLNKHNMVAFTGEAGDTVNFCEYIRANTKLYSVRYNHDLTTSAVASFVRNELHGSLRTRKPYQVNLLVAGYDTKQEEPALYYIDYIGTQVKLPYGAHGYAGYYCLSLLDRHYKAGMSLEDAVDVLRLCEAELDKRLPIGFKGLQVKVVDKNGIREVEY